MLPISGTEDSTESLLGGLIVRRRSRSPSGTIRKEHRLACSEIGPYKIALVAFSITCALSSMYLIGMFSVTDRFFSQSMHQESAQYDTKTCGRLDSAFEFESPPDFTRLGIEAWTDCRPVKALEGWKVEHCTAPGSTWPATDVCSALEEEKQKRSKRSSSSFLARPFSPEPGRQRVCSPVSASSFESALSTQEESGSPAIRAKVTHCNPSGYFRVQRLSSPTTDYTIGSDHPEVDLRCHSNPNNPVSANAAVQSYSNNTLGPDILRLELAGAERYVTQQQIYLGNCTYALPYVLSRPGQFMLMNIEHVLQDFEGLKENFKTGVHPNLLNNNILPPVPSSGRETQQDSQEPVSSLYQFTVCGGCPELEYSNSFSKYEDLPSCSLGATDGARQYGVYAGTKAVSTFEDLETQTYEWVGARPRCRHHPLLRLFKDPLLVAPVHDKNISSLNWQHQWAMSCLGRNRSIYLAGDSHLRELFVGVTKRLRGFDDHFTDISGLDTHVDQIEGVFVRQDFDQWMDRLSMRLQYSLGEYASLGTQLSNKTLELDLLEHVDSIILDFAAWPAAQFYDMDWPTDRYIKYIQEVLWRLAKVRSLRQEHYKRSGKGYNDLRIVWAGIFPWPEWKGIPDYRTNSRQRYWDTLVNEEIDKINEHYREQGGMIDRLGAFSKLLPLRGTVQDGSHYTAKEPLDVLVQVLLHKLGLCT